MYETCWHCGFARSRELGQSKDVPLLPWLLSVPAFDQHHLSDKKGRPAYLVVISQEFVQEIDSVITDEPLVLRVDK